MQAPTGLRFIEERNKLRARFSCGTPSPIGRQLRIRGKRIDLAAVVRATVRCNAKWVRRMLRRTHYLESSADGDSLVRDNKACAPNPWICVKDKRTHLSVDGSSPGRVIRFKQVVTGGSEMNAFKAGLT